MSTIKFNQWQNPDGTENYKCRAWVNFNGTGTVAIRASGNVASITDNGVGDYTINFTTAMPDTSYAPVYGFSPDAMFSSGSGATRSLFTLAQTVGGVRIQGGVQATPALIDYGLITVSVFR